MEDFLWSKFTTEKEWEISLFFLSVLLILRDSVVVEEVFRDVGKECRRGGF